MSLFLWLPAFLILYVLSAGPMVRLEEAHIVSNATLEIVYAPLGWVVKNNDTAGRFMMWYLSEVWGWNPAYPK
jgi:hypothetical protein